MEDQTYKPLNFFTVLRFLFRWRYYLATVLIVTAIITGIMVSPLVTKPKYQSKSTFYPTNIGSLSSNLLEDNPAKEYNYMDIGGESQIQQYLEILQSMRIKKYIREKFNLFQHYGIDKSKKGAYAKFENTYSSNIEFSKTQFMAIEVSVEDKDPKMAAKIANEIVYAVDSFRNEMKQEKAQKALNIVKKTYELQERKISELTDSLQALGDKGIFDWQQQTRSLVENYGKARISNDQDFLNELENEYDKFGKYGPIQHELSQATKFHLERLSVLRDRYLKIKADAKEKLSHVYLLRKGVASDKVHSPNYMLVMVVALIAAFLMSCIVFSFWENYSRLKGALEN